MDNQPNEESVPTRRQPDWIEGVYHVGLETYPDELCNCFDREAVTNAAASLRDLSTEFTASCAKATLPRYLIRDISLLSRNAFRVISHATSCGAFDPLYFAANGQSDQRANPSSTNDTDQTQRLIVARDWLADFAALPLIHLATDNGTFISEEKQAAYLRDLLSQQCFFDGLDAEDAVTFQMLVIHRVFLWCGNDLPPDFLGSYNFSEFADEADAEQIKQLEIFAEGLAAACVAIARMFDVSVQQYREDEADKAEPKKRTKKRGRPTKYDPAIARCAYDAWQTGEHESRAACAASLGLTPKEFKLAYERERKRREKACQAD